MPTSKKELARRIREARNAAGLTQVIVAEELGMARSTIADVESGRRSVSGVELERIAFLFGRDVREFLAEDFSDEGVLNSLFRAEPDAAEGEAVLPKLRHCLALARELQNLEELAGLQRSGVLGTSYIVSAPRTRWDAIQQGEHLAEAERQRLGLGKSRVGEFAEMLDSQGVRSAAIDLPDDISGLTFTADTIPVFVAVNRRHAPNRQRFSFAHEYCHVLIDRNLRGLVSRGSERNELREVRANAFAAAFLLPHEGVAEAVEQLAKGMPSRQASEVFDEAEAISAETRAEPGSQDIQYYDVVQLASQFGTSPAAMIYRLRNLRFITEAELAHLKEEDDKRCADDLARIMDLPQTEPEDGAHRIFLRRFLALGLEVYRREKITRSKFRELAQLVAIGQEPFERLLNAAGLSDVDAAVAH